jgi:hypothetical protein
MIRIIKEKEQIFVCDPSWHASPDPGDPAFQQVIAHGD